MILETKTTAHHTFLIGILHIFGLAFAYFVAGKLGNFLVIPPNFATVVFPSSGIALAGILLYRKQDACLGILIGAFLLNAIPVTATHLSEIINSELINLAIACGGTLQALVGAFLVQKLAGKPNILSTKKNILLFLFYGGIVSSLVNSTFSMSLLVATGRVSTEEFFFNWLSWWSGDALGIIIFAPLFLIWFSTENPVWQNKKSAITLPIVALFVVTIVAIFYQIEESKAQVKIEFEQRTKELNGVLEAAITTKLTMLRSLNSFFVLSKTPVSRAEFQAFVTATFNNFQGIQAVQWIPIIQAVHRDAYEKSIQKEGFPNFQITERNANNEMVRAGIRAEYAVVNFNEPFKGNEIVSGYDTYSDSTRRESIDKARDTADISISSPTILVQEKETQKGFIAFMPLYRSDLPHETLEERRNTISSYVVAVFRANDMLTEAFKKQNLTDLSYRLIDKSSPVGEQLLVANGEFNSTKETESLISRATFDVGGRTWQFEIVPSSNYFMQHSPINFLLILAAGVLLTVMTMIAILVSTLHMYHIQRLNENKTSTNQKLTVANEQLLQVKVGLDNLSTGVIIADNNRKVIYVNPSAIKLFSNIELAVRKDIKEFSACNIIGTNIDLFHTNPFYQKNLLLNLTETIEANMPMGGHVINIKASSMMNEIGVRIGWVAEWQDITEKENRALELASSRNENKVLGLQVNHMQKLESIGRLTSGIAHDFNNILACMLGYNELNVYISEDMTDNNLRDELEKNTKQISAAGHRATALISKMMTYCRQHTPKEKIDIQPTTQVILEVLAMLRPALTSRIKLEKVLETHATIQMDAIDLHQILTNLVVNARDAMKERGGIITLSLKNVTKLKTYCVACAGIMDNDFIELSVSDNGTGIKPEIVNRLFDPFFTTKPQGEGTGLGLAAVSGLVHQAGGHILIESNEDELNHGTTFKLLFPIA